MYVYGGWQCYTDSYADAYTYTDAYIDTGDNPNNTGDDPNNTGDDPDNTGSGRNARYTYRRNRGRWLLR